MASIAVRQFKLGNLPFAHNFLVRYDDNGNIVGELHGFAIDPNTNERKAIGRSSDYLRAREPALGDRFYAEGQPEHEPLDSHRPRKGCDLGGLIDDMRGAERAG